MSSSPWIPNEGYNVWKDDEGNKVQRNLRFKPSKGQVPPSVQFKLSTF